MRRESPTKTLAGVLTSMLLLACEEKKPFVPPLASSEDALREPPLGGPRKRFTLDRASTTSIALDAPKEKIRAATFGCAGRLDIDFANLARSRGQVRVDLTTLKTSTFRESNRNDRQTTHARAWLEVADGEEWKLDEKTKEANRFAVYDIRAIEHASAKDVSKVPSTKNEGEEVRTVRLTTKGELLVHGRKVERDAEVEIALHYAAGAAADAPKLLSIKSTSPFRVVLAEHDVKPRDALGKVVKTSLSLFGTKVADTAAITLDLRAEPEP